MERVDWNRIMMTDHMSMRITWTEPKPSVPHATFIQNHYDQNQRQIQSNNKNNMFDRNIYPYIRIDTYKEAVDVGGITTIKLWY